MNDDERESLAAEYVLGTLSVAERERVDARLAEDAELRDAVARWSSDLSGMEPADASPAPARDLWASIEGRIGQLFPAGTVTQSVTEGDWQIIGPGISRKILYRDEAQGMHSFLLRLSPGTVIPSHPHRRDEECLVLEGELRIGDLSVGPGGFHLARAGVTHPPIRVESPTLVYIRGAVEARG